MRALITRLICVCHRYDSGIRFYDVDAVSNAELGAVHTDAAGDVLCRTADFP